MRLDETLELDAIIKEWDAKSDDIITVTSNKGHNLRGLNTYTGVFDPTESGKHSININGQKLTIKVTSKKEVIEDFEDGDISNYYGDTGNYSISTSRTFSGSYSLYSGGNNDSIYCRSGLDRYPQPGDKFEIRTYHGDSNAGSSFGFGFNSNKNGNYAGYHGGNDEWFITNLDDGPDGGGTKNDSNPSAGQWWKWVVEWYTDGTADFTVYDDSDNIIAGPITYNNAGKYTSKGIWFSTAHQFGNHDHWWDSYRITGST